MPQSSEPSGLSLALLQAVPGADFLPWAPVYVLGVTAVRAPAEGGVVLTGGVLGE